MPSATENSNGARYLFPHHRSQPAPAFAARTIKLHRASAALESNPFRLIGAGCTDHSYQRCDGASGVHSAWPSPTGELGLTDGASAFCYCINVPPSARVPRSTTLYPSIA
jgi:hypothetical protein